MLPWEALLLIKAVHTNSCEEGSKQDIVCMTHGNQPRKKQMSLLAFHLVHFDLNLVDCETMHQLDCFACRRDLLSGCRGLANVYLVISPNVNDSFDDSLITAFHQNAVYKFSRQTKCRDKGNF